MRSSSEDVPAKFIAALSLYHSLLVTNMCIAVLNHRQLVKIQSFPNGLQLKKNPNKIHFLTSCQKYKVDFELIDVEKPESPTSEFYFQISDKNFT